MSIGKDKWIEKIIASGEEIKNLHAPEHLFYDVLANIRNEHTKVIKLNPREVRLALAAACIMAILNVGILLMANHSQESKESAYIESYDLNLYK